MPDPLPAHPAALPNGHSIAEYEIVRVLGAGGFGITYLAFDHQLDGPVAIKEYFPAELATRVDDDQVAATGPTNRAALATDKSGTDTFAWGLERFLEEARAVDRFRHPNVVQARRYLEANGTAYLVMEYVEGESLKSILDRRGSLPAEEWRPWMDALLGGLEHVHSHGYLHRDIKPANIVIRSEDGEPVLIDFGSARLQHRDRTHTQVLTAAYAPIEQHSTGAIQGPPADIYALAATAYRALAGTPVSSAPDRILNDDYEPLADRLGSTERQWLAGIDHGLAVRPENRPQTVEEWRTELGTAAGAAPPKSSTGRPENAEVTIRTRTQPTRAFLDTPRRLARRRPAVAALGALLLFGVAALSVVLLTNDTSPDGTSENRPPLERPGPAVAAGTDTADAPPRQEEAPLGSFRVVAEPSNSRVEFLDSEASYVPGMPLPPGQYRIQVSAPGHRSSETAIEHGGSSTVLRVDLSAETVAANDSNASSPSSPAGDVTDAEAQYELGVNLIRDSFGPLSEDHDTQAEGVELLSRAAGQGHAEAQLRLGRYYEWGLFGVPQDEAEAASWYRKAADQGSLGAQLELASMYRSGTGVPQDEAEAASWYRKAADQGHAAAQFNLAFMYYHGQGMPKDRGEAAAWYRKAAEQGHAGAQSSLGVLYFNGDGVPQDYVRAYAWLNVAAAQDHEDAKEAKENRDTVGRRMTREQIAEAQSLSRVLVSQ